MRLCLTLWLLASVPPSAGAAHPKAPPDSTVFKLHPSSRLVLKTGKAGLFGFAGHTHVIQARGVSGELVYHPGKAAR